VAPSRAPVAKQAEAVTPKSMAPQLAAAPAAIAVRQAAAGPKYNDLMSAVMVADPAALQELLAFGKWPDKPDSNGLTPLMVAAMRGDRESAELLLKAGADAERALDRARGRGDAAMTSLLERYATSKRP
jgi:regulator of protease activity HflC (stomatin/prohibitin superfamily)